MGLFFNSALAGLALVAFYASYRRRTRDVVAQQSLCSPPPRFFSKDPLFNMDFAIRIHLDLDSMWQAHTQVGPTFQPDSLFGSEKVYTIEPDNIQKIFAVGKDFGIEPLRLPAMEYFCGQGFLTTDGPIWHQSRKMLKPSFAKNNISDLTFLSYEFDNLLTKIPNDGSMIDIQPLLFMTFLKTSLYFLLGVDPSADSQGSQYTSEQFVEVFEAAVLGTGVRLMLGPFRTLAPGGKFVKASHEYLDFHIKHALEAKKQSTDTPMVVGQKPRSMAEGLAAQTEDIRYIRGQILQALMASQETIAALISNALLLLSRNPQYWQQLRKEACVAGDELLSFDNLSNFRFLQNILKEALRLYPIFPLMARTCLQNTTLPTGGGPKQDQPIFVRKCTDVSSSFYALHRNEAVFGPRVFEFVPERWDKINPKQWEYLQFGGGQRGCLGKDKVLVESAYVLARLAQTFAELDSRDERPYKGSVMPTAKNEHGCRIGLRRAE